MNLGLTDIQLIKIETRLAKVGIDLQLENNTRKETFSKLSMMESGERYIGMLSFVDACEPKPVYPNNLKNSDKISLDVERDILIEKKVEAICWQIDHILEDNSLKSAERQIAELHLEGVSRNVISSLYNYSTSKLNRIINRRVRVRDRYS